MKSILRITFTLTLFVFSLSTYGEAHLSLCRLGHSLGFLQLDVAEAAGFLGTDTLQVESIIFRSGKDCSEAIKRGDVQAAVLGVDHALSAANIGVSIKQVAALNQIPGWAFVISSNAFDGKHSTNELDLRHKNIGVTSPGSATHVLTNYLLYKQGISSAEYTIVKAGSGTLPDIMKQGGIDAGMALEPYGSLLVSSNEAKIMFDFRSVAGTNTAIGALYPMTSLLIREDYLNENHAKVQELVQAIVTASVWLSKSSAQEVLKLLPASIVPNPEVWSMSYDNSRDVFSPQGMPDSKGFNTVVEANRLFGSIPANQKFVPEDFLDMSFWKAANKNYQDLNSRSTRDSGINSSANSPNILKTTQTSSRLWLVLAAMAIVLLVITVLKRNN